MMRTLGPLGVAELLLVFAVGLGDVLGCGGDETSTPTGSGTVACNEDPWTCAASETCWVASDYSFQCMSAGTGVAGDPCAPEPGTVACAAGLTCVHLVPGDNSSTTCVPFCDPNDPARECATGVCSMITFTRPDTGDPLAPFFACLPE